MSFLHHYVSPVCPRCAPGVPPVCPRCPPDVSPVCPLCVPHVSPVCQETLKVSGPSLLSSVPTSLKTGNNGADPDLLRHDHITKMWVGFKPTGQSEMLLSETMKRVLEVIWSVFTLAC